VIDGAGPLAGAYPTPTLADTRPGWHSSARMFIRRRPQEPDWQSELRERTAAVTGPAAEAATARRAGKVKRVRRILALLMVIAWVVLQFSDYSAKHSRDSLEWLVGGFLLLTFAPVLVAETLKAVRRKWDPPLTVTDDEGDVRARIRNDLRQAGLELRQMLVEPTERALYERWLKSETEQLDLIEPNTARRWAQPDPGEISAGKVVSDAELDKMLQAPSARAITSS
jgi:hypothetical protein